MLGIYILLVLQKHFFAKSPRPISSVIISSKEEWGEATILETRPLVFLWAPRWNFLRSEDGVEEGERERRWSRGAHLSVGRER